MSKIKTDIIEPVGSTISISGNASMVSGTISANNATVGSLTATNGLSVTGGAIVYGDIEVYNGGFIRSGGLSVTGDVSASGNLRVGNFPSGNIAPLPSSAAGVGQFILLRGTTLDLPGDSSQTWAYFILLMLKIGDTSNDEFYPAAGVAVGGTRIGSAGGGRTWGGFAWRIS